ncbi:MAG: hypothetical protein HZA50_16055 [Planctomycetes bacterium]|nr:hypothetical protein [Planctomycetota bacterium]
MTKVVIVVEKKEDQPAIRLVTTNKSRALTLVRHLIIENAPKFDHEELLEFNDEADLQRDLTNGTLLKEGEHYYLVKSAKYAVSAKEYEVVD